MTALTHSRVGASGGCNGGRGKLLLRCRMSVAQSTLAPTLGGEGWGHTVVAARLQLVWFALCIQIVCICLELIVL